MIELRVLELLCARFCHEMVSPVGAIGNGVELLDEDDPEFVREAIALIGQSARTASRRLQFYRFAYGTAPTASNVTPRELLLGFLEGGKVGADWEASVSSLSSEWQRLACNLAVLAAETLPRGGRIAVRSGPVSGRGVEVEASGESVSVNRDVAAALAGNVNPAELSSRTIHGHVTAKFAEQLGAVATLAESGPSRALFVASQRYRPYPAIGRPRGASANCFLMGFRQFSGTCRRVRPVAPARLVARRGPKKWTICSANSSPRRTRTSRCWIASL
jgi:histidine phosphotransferase ChpT